MSARNFTDHDIHLALDGELPTEERPAFERWLEAHPDMKALSRRFASDRTRLQEALEPIVSEPLPPALEATGRPRSKSGLGPALRAAAAVLLLAVGAAGGYALSAGGWIGSEFPAARIGSDAIAAHVIYANEKRHVVEVSADQEHLVGWLSNRLGTDLVAPDFSGAGYALVGGRLLPADGRAAAQFMYERADGDRISLYVTRDPERRQSGLQLRREKVGCAYYWLGNGYGYVVAGTSSEETLLTLAGEAQRQLPVAGS